MSRRKVKKSMEVVEKDVKIIQRRVPKYDYLKYYKVVRYWARYKYDLGTQDLEILQFIYTERLFSRHRFDEYSQIFSFDNKRFKKLLRDGWIRSWRNAEGGRGALYEASFKTKHMMASFYKKLNGEEEFPTATKENPVFKRDTYTKKVMSNEMLRINKEIRLRHGERNNRIK
jgi:hypothetical protein